MTSVASQFPVLFPIFLPWCPIFIFIELNGVYCFLATLKIPSPTNMAITIGVRWELRGKNICNEEGISKHRNFCSIINKIFSYAINVKKCLFSLLLSLLMPSPAVAHMSWVRLWEVHLLQVQGFCFPLWNPGRNGHCGTKADPKESPCCRQSALPLEVGSTPEQDCQERFPECSRDAPAQSLAAAASLLCSQVCPSSAMSRVRVLFCDSLWDHPSKQTTGN